MDAGLDVDQAARKLRFSFSVSSNYFMEIAKFRAARMLWANIVKGYGPAKNCACKMHIHAETSRWNQTVYDPYVNMLRGTTEAMSATIAGVHSLEVTPFDTSFENPTEFSKRIARNVELLLKNESHFDQVVDPAGGSSSVSKRRPQPRTRTSLRAARRCSAPTNIPTLRRSPARRSPPSPLRASRPRAMYSSPTAVPWRSKRCACRWIAAARSPRHSC